MATKAGVNADVAINADVFDFPGWTYVIGRARGAGEEWPAGQQNKENRSYWEFGPAVARLVEPGSTAPGAGVTGIVAAHNVLIGNGKSLAPNFDGDGGVALRSREGGVTKPVAEVNALLRGPDVRTRPLLTRASAGAVYVLDDPGALPPGATAGPDGRVRARVTARRAWWKPSRWGCSRWRGGASAVARRAVT